MASSLSEPSPRWGHYSAAVGGQLYVYGGRTTKNFFAGKSVLGGCIHSYNQCMEKWQTRETTGKPHPGLFHGTSTSSGHNLYFYGGHDGSSYHDSFYQLDTGSLEWSQLPSGPMKKAGCGIVSYQEKLVLLGGYSIRSGTTQPGAQFINDSRYTDGRGWTNELHMFDVQKGMWSSPIVTGTRPPPRRGFSLTLVDKHHAVLFGGYGPIHGVSNHVYILDLMKMHWSELDKNEGPWPVGRDDHAAVCLWSGGDHPQLLVTGGKDKNNKVLSDAWLLDLQAGRWREVDVPGLQARFDHSATAFNLCPGLMEVTLFGGCPQWPSNFKTDAGLPQIAKTTVLQLEYQECSSSAGPPTGEWTLTGMADSSQLGTRERIDKKAAKMIQAIPTSPATPKPAHGDSGIGRDPNNQEAERRVEEAERRLRETMEECNRRVQAAEDRAKEIEERMGEEGRRVQAAEERAREAEERLKKVAGAGAQPDGLGGTQGGNGTRATMIFLKRETPTMNDLAFIKNQKGENFRLLSRIAGRWKTIAEVLGLDDVTIDHITKQRTGDDEPVRQVFRKWFENASELPRSQFYPLTWYGLNQLMIDSEMKEIANKYFTFLETCYIN